MDGYFKMIKTKKRLCIYHNDNDGKLAGAMVKYKFPETELIEVGYNDYREKLNFLLNYVELPCYDEIFILDFSLDQHEMERLINNYTVIWCDHHKSAKEELEEIWNNPEIKGLRSLDKCGAMLTWNYFGNESFEELKLVDDYDRGILQYGEKTHHFIELNKEWTIKQWIECIKKTGTGVMSKYLSEGKSLFNLKLQRIEQVIKKGLPLSFKGGKALLVNNSNTMDGALLGNKICELGYDIAIKFEFNKDKIIFGLNSIGELDVSKIAKEYGGGGHKNASGFILSPHDFSKFLKHHLKEEEFK